MGENVIETEYEVENESGIVIDVRKNCSVHDLV